jgi:hypothetical protein
MPSAPAIKFEEDENYVTFAIEAFPAFLPTAEFLRFGFIGIDGLRGSSYEIDMRPGAKAGNFTGVSIHRPDQRDERPLLELIAQPFFEPHGSGRTSRFRLTKVIHLQRMTGPQAKQWATTKIPPDSSYEMQRPGAPPSRIAGYQMSDTSAEYGNWTSARDLIRKSEEVLGSAKHELEKLEEAAKKGGKSEEQQKADDDKRRSFEAQRDAAQLNVDRCKALDNLLQTLDGARLHYRVYVDHESTEVDVIRTKE